MKKFHIELNISTYVTKDLYVESSSLDMEVVKHLSNMDGVEYVSVSMFSRIRFIVANGIITKSCSDLNEFYLDVTPQMQWDWTACGTYKD